MLHWIAQTRTEDLSPWLMLAAAGAVVLLVLILVSPLLRKSHDPLSPRPTGSGEPTLVQQRAVERDMQTLMHELSDMARRIGGELDARSARLEHLLREADERFARLEAAAHSNGSNGHAPPEASAPPPRSEPSLATAPEIDPRHAQIYTLLDEGLSPPQIADRLGRPDGEVELIIALRPRAGRTSVGGMVAPQESV